MEKDFLFIFAVGLFFFAVFVLIEDFIPEIVPSFGDQATVSSAIANELGLDIKDHEIIRTNSTGLVIYNPKNLAERIKGMKNTEKTREQKIAERVAYMQQQQNNSENLN